MDSNKQSSAIKKKKQQQPNNSCWNPSVRPVVMLGFNEPRETNSPEVTYRKFLGVKVRNVPDLHACPVTV